MRHALLILLLFTTAALILGVAADDAQEPPLDSLVRQLSDEDASVRRTAAATKATVPALPKGALLTDRSVIAKVFVLRESSLGELPPGMSPRELSVSPDLRRVAYVAEREGKQLVVEDGVEHRPYDYIKMREYHPRGPYLCFSGRGEHLAYVAGQDGREVVVLDGKEGKEHRTVRVGSIAFSADGERIVYVATRGNKQLAVVDGVAGTEYDEIRYTSFSSDSKHVLYEARSGNKRWLVTDGVEGDLRAYIAKRGRQSLMDLDGIEGKTYDQVGPAVFSRDGRRVAYTATRGERCLVVVDGVEQQEHAGRVQGRPVFSPDGNRLAYLVQHGETQSVVVDGAVQDEYDKVSASDSYIGRSRAPFFSPNSKHVAYVAQRGKEEVVVVDGVQNGAFPGMIWEPVFSADGERFAYGVIQREESFVVVDGKRGKSYGAVDDIRFSPDGKRVAFEATTARPGEREGNAFVVVDGEEGRPFDRMHTAGPIFSPDGRHVIYIGGRGEKHVIVVDQAESREYDFIWRQSRGVGLPFDGPTSFHTLALRDQEVWLLEFEITEG